jgi:hypothetical protein
VRGIGQWLRENPLKSVLLLGASSIAASSGMWGVGGTSGSAVYLVFQFLVITLFVASLQGARS